jgi:hypothetical protein
MQNVKKTKNCSRLVSQHTFALNFGFVCLLLYMSSGGCSGSSSGNMFEFELPCDWSVNRRPSNNNNGGIVGTNDHPPTLLCKGKAKQQQQQQQQSTAVVGGGCVMVRMKPILNQGTIQDSNSTSSPGQASTDKTQEEIIMNPILGHILGPKSSLSLDESFFSQQRPYSRGSGDAEKGHEMQPAGGVQLPWSGQIKKLVIKHLQSANAMAENPGCLDDGNILHKLRAQESYLDTESLLSKLPYKKMLSDMFGGNLRGHLQTSVIPYVSRAYEEAFMHEPVNSSERECARGKQCECMFIDRLQPFTAVEFLLPGEQAPKTPHLCVLCCRAVTQQLYYDVIFDKCEFPGTIQRFGNIHSEPGEYALDAMLIASSTAPVYIMPLPIVSHQRNRYSVFITSGIKRLKQSRVHFHSTPSCSAGNGQ